MTLTSLGDHTMREMSVQREQLAADLVAGLGEAEQRALASGLDRLARRFEALSGVRRRRGAGIVSTTANTSGCSVPVLPTTDAARPYDVP